MGKVVPLHKSGNTHSPLNYGPISLISVTFKLLKHIIYSYLAPFLEFNLFLFFSICQHGYRKHFSCEMHLLSITSDLFGAFDKNLITNCIFLDDAKAFDTVSHNLLLPKMSKLNIDPNIVGCIPCFLTLHFWHSTFTLMIITLLLLLLLHVYHRDRFWAHNYFLIILLIYLPVLMLVLSSLPIIACFITNLINHRLFIICN